MRTFWWFIIAGLPLLGLSDLLEGSERLGPVFWAAMTSVTFGFGWGIAEGWRQRRQS